MYQWTLRLFAFMWLGAVTNQSYAQEAFNLDHPLPDRPLIVGTKTAEPFVIKEDDGTFSGISIELWQQIAEEMGLQYEFRETDLAGLINGLQDGTIDV
jgi:ABC-type amino acid transport substrate-binding protein